MQVRICTYQDRYEVAIALPDGVSPTGGAEVREADSGRYAVWCFSTGVSDFDVKAAATECARLLVASSPGDGIKPESEEPVKSQTVTVTL